MSETVSAKAIRAVLGAARLLDLNAEELARARGLGAAMTDVDTRFPYQAWLQTWQDVAERAVGDAIGIRAAERLPWGHWDVVDYLVGTSDNLGTALRRFERYFPLISTGVSHHLVSRDGELHLERRYLPNCYTRVLAPTEFSFAAIVSHFRIALKLHWVPRRVTFAAPAPSDQGPYRKFFGCEVEFDTAVSAIVIDPADLQLPLSGADPELSRIMMRHADQIVGQLGSAPGFVDQVRQVIVNALPEGDVTVALVARKLGVSVRTLQRRLAESELSFDDVFDTLRKDLARRYLGDPKISIQETAHLLAFGDLRGFYRAFKRWEDCTPAEFRKRSREPESRAGA